MLQITEYNTRFKLDLQKPRALNYDWKGMGVRKRGKRSFAPILETGTNQEPKPSSKPEVWSLFSE